mmetsp:Transcript_117298/g.252228  ORF Transcript_117298/g.252228 Transcript_117298/m.252228 type:complete len:139 (-) Transcript_117298:383-799(-)
MGSPRAALPAPGKGLRGSLGGLWEPPREDLAGLRDDRPGLSGEGGTHRCSLCDRSGLPISSAAAYGTRLGDPPPAKMTSTSRGPGEDCLPGAAAAGARPGGWDDAVAPPLHPRPSAKRFTGVTTEGPGRRPHESPPFS